MNTDEIKALSMKVLEVVRIAGMESVDIRVEKDGYISLITRISDGDTVRTRDDYRFEEDGEKWGCYYV